MEKVSTTSKRLKEYMKLTGLKQVDILDRCKLYEGDKIKISKSHLSQYISGKFEPNQARLEILAKAMGVDEIWLMGYDVPMTGDTDDFGQKMFDDEKTLFDDYRHLSSEGKKTARNLVKTLRAQEEDND